MIHLDTSFLIRALVRGSTEDLHLREWLRSEMLIGISTVGWAEFLCGPVEEHQVDLTARILTEQVCFVAEDASRAARLFNLTGRRRGSLSDCMIAATALRTGATLATANPADFRRLEAAGLKIIAV